MKNIIFVIVLSGLVTGCNNSRATVDVDLHKKLAGELRDNKLYDAAIEEYKKVLTGNSLELNQRANINYLIGKIYFEDLKEYEQAAAFYVKAKSLEPEASFTATASKNLVTSFEKMGRMLDAKRQLDKETNIDNSPRYEGDMAVAKIGGKTIWLSEIDEQIQSLPPEVQKQYMNIGEKTNFVHQYIGIELIYRAAMRENYSENKEIKKRLQLFEKNMIVDSYAADKIIPNIKIDTSDLKNYYTANKETRYNNSSYDSVKAQVLKDYQSNKMEAAYSDYIQTLAKVEKVEFFDQNIR